MQTHKRAIAAVVLLATVLSPTTAGAQSFEEWYAQPENREYYHFQQWYGASEKNAVYYHIRDEFGNGRLGDQALRVAQCESQMNPRAKSPTNDHGVFQLNAPSHRHRFPQVTGHAWSPNVYHASHNARYAKWLYDELGWQPWTCQP